jgi:F-type H+-transporting ATPase subunit gamma
MPNLKEIKTRIGSVKKTKQITSAMKLVAAAKLKRAQDRAVAARPYRDKLGGTLARVAAASSGDSDPLLAQRDEVKRVKLVILTTDRGMCGAFNGNLLRKLTYWLKDNAGKFDVDIEVYGRKGKTYLSGRDIEMINVVTDYAKTPKMDLVRPTCNDAVQNYLDGTYDEVYLVYNQFKSVMTQLPTFTRLLPMEIDEAGEAGADFRYEPGAEEVLGALLPLYLRTIVLQAFLETDAGEFAAKMTAMDNATRNASDLIDSLSLQYNRARQAAITTEITEIVSGAEAV